MTFPLRWYPADTQIDLSDRILAFCAEEVRRQGDTPWHVYRMVDAWRWAQERRESHPALDHATVREIGRRIDEANESGYRTGPVQVGGRLIDHHDIHANMTVLLGQQATMSPADWYLAFERIHPFFDGNGRTGKVLYNWLRGSLPHPVWPPDFFSTPGRRIENP